ncbi:MAG TPA: ImmA/IrrE family metallo-endopeptidase [Clostridiales bacterium]|nr:ImmA/IrrE family metallo-endopeptidase [Clostridiales bacterium]
MDYDRIKYAVYGVFKTCSIHALPFDCMYILAELGYKCKKYSDMSEKGFDACLELSNDAHTIGKEIFYNDKKAKRRIRFSLMHELGHLVLDTDDEAEANTFASNILAPSMAVHYSNIKNVRELSNLFDVSLECAKYALDTCEKWSYSAKKYGMTDIDKKLYNHFFDRENQRFVFKKTQCAYCDTILFNSNKPLCQECDKPHHDPLSYTDHRTEDFIIAENQWLYGGF